MAHRHDLSAALDALLQPERFRDYGPNGLQVEGRAEVRRIVSGVTASRALIEAAVADGADAIFVHHGLFWRGQDGRVTGWMKQRLALLLQHDINLFAYHLPLDAHLELGNNAQLARVLGLRALSRFGDQDLGFLGEVAADVDGQAPVQGTTPVVTADATPDTTARAGFADAQALAAHVGRCLGRAPVCVPGDGRALRRIAWCTGGAQGSFEAAIAAGADAYITGEISEPQAHYARECGVAFLACGHHATERYGAPAVAAHVAAALGMAHRFIDVDNPA